MEIYAVEAPEEEDGIARVPCPLCGVFHELDDAKCPYCGMRKAVMLRKHEDYGNRKGDGTHDHL